MAEEAATASGTLPVVKISLRARVRLVAITAHGSTSCSKVAGRFIAASVRRYRLSKKLLRLRTYRYAIRSGLRSKRSRFRIDRHTWASWSIVSRSGLAASATALKAPELHPTRPSGLMPASSSALRTPTLHAPRLPPPPRTKTSLRCLSPPGEDEFRRRRHQDSMEGDRQNPVSRIEVTYKIPIRPCARAECNRSVSADWKLVDSALSG